ncbi:hypothetical protein Tco_1120934 [Tanacetum coccineum]|uniref:Uncharacterized protein n=1 Tax=Tanacetum coccineum TaxID=301880 RepID=A0ABQ5IWG4_9ASTR
MSFCIILFCVRVDEKVVDVVVGWDSKADIKEDEAEEQMIAPVVDMDEDIAMLFGDDDFEDDASEGFDDEEV